MRVKSAYRGNSRRLFLLRNTGNDRAWSHRWLTLPVHAAQFGPQWAKLLRALEGFAAAWSLATPVQMEKINGHIQPIWVFLNLTSWSMLNRQNDLQFGV